jgi:DNA-binding response OmpR family regulator
MNESATTITLLLVEDTMTQAMYMQHALSQAGFKVILARSGEKALEVLADFSQAIPYAVLSDINMPGISGYELIKQLKADERTKAMRAILLTTASQLTEVAEILNCGADGMVFKSSSKERFVAQVNLALSQTDNGLSIDGETLSVPSSSVNNLFLAAYQQIIDLQNQ